MKEKHYIAIIVIITAALAAISAIGVFSLNIPDMEQHISASLQLKDSYLKKYTYPEVKSHIFSAFVKPKPIVIAPKKAEPPPVDPYEQYYKDLKNYQIIGSSKDGNNTIIFLSKGDTTVNVKKGDTFGEKYVVNELTDNEITVGLTDDPNFTSKITQK